VDSPVEPISNEPRQRWRLYVRLPAAAAPGELPTGSGGWASLLDGTGLPLARGPLRSRVVLAAQLPLGIAGEREFLDVTLTVCLPIVEVGERVRAVLPPPIELIDLHDVWLGAPSATAAVVAADYRVEVAGVPAPRLRAAIEALLAATTLPIERHRDRKSQRFDLRPLIVSLTVADMVAPGEVDMGVPVTLLRTRLGHRPEAAGRPEDLLRALGGPPAPPLGGEIHALRITRERLLTGDDA
jgi:radical SAM-linked protein